MKKFILPVFLLVILFTISGCEQAPSTNENYDKKNKITQDTKSGFRMELPIKKSGIKGISTDNDIIIDYNNMEKDLLDISKNYVNPADFLYTPGNILKPTDVSKLLQRESTSNEWGLNPKSSQKKETAPIYANTIIEQDFFKYEKKKKVYNTISFGIGIDPTYQNQKVTNEEIENYVTKKLAIKLTKYLKKYKKQEHCNIVIGIYKENNSNTMPGYFLTYGQIKAGATVPEKININNIKYIIFPDTKEEKNSKLNITINDLQRSLSHYFEDYSSLIAVGKYKDDKLASLKITININNYSPVEIDAFLNYFDENIEDLKQYTGNIDIIISSSGGNNLALLTYENGCIKNRYIYSTN